MINNLLISTVLLTSFSAISINNAIITNKTSDEFLCTTEWTYVYRAIGISETNYFQANRIAANTRSDFSPTGRKCLWKVACGPGNMDPTTAARENKVFRQEINTCSENIELVLERQADGAYKIFEQK